MRNSVLLIPALNPPEDIFLKYIQSLKNSGFNNIIIINDGSRKEYDEYFKKLCLIDGCVVLNHAVNLGKGRALKNGMNYFMNVYSNNTSIKGLITADSDGQHTVEDVIKLDDALDENDNTLLLGSRNFNYDNVPFKSKFGNKLTSKIFRLFFGLKIMDTQTGLRGIPKALIKDFIQLRGERFEYETNMLIEASHKKIQLKEIMIKTVYIDNNSETHFNPFSDSLAIYSLLFGSFFKYIIASLSSFIIDITFFKLFLICFGGIASESHILFATIGARVISSFYNYNINRSIVFKDNKSMKKTLIKYYVLCVIQMLCSAGMTIGILKLLPADEVIVKAIVDAVLFCISYQIQHRWIFSGR